MAGYFEVTPLNVFRIADTEQGKGWMIDTQTRNGSIVIILHWRQSCECFLKILKELFWLFKYTRFYNHWARNNEVRWGDNNTP